MRYQIVTQAALLDPRFKKLAFDAYHVRKLEIAMEQLKANVCQVTITETENPTTVLGTNNNSTHPHYTSLHFHIIGLENVR